MYICFANTDSQIYGLSVIQEDQAKITELRKQSSDDYDYPMELPFVHPHFMTLGSISLHRDGFVIVDRHAEQVSTQLNVKSMLSTVIYLLTSYYNATGTVTIYLPRMSSSMNEEAAIQHKIQTMLDKQNKACTSPNLRLMVHLKPV